ncbi:hypothetical protein A9176_07750 [Leuconostoc garlicum]|uniref:Uncharacterized protein n=1 Tax=Leuconostoc garlicum TaxID=255248 RepID=A0ABM6HV30_9LACO|nr:hypothetical protein [Leuconostoc garlicum]AQN80246.1 hypothetical protein A9176_07750 [Leuconostoc garlicum]
MKMDQNKLVEIIEKQNSYIGQLEVSTQKFSQQQREMAIEYQKLFDMVQVQRLMVKLLGTDMKKIAEGDYSVNPVPAKEMKDIKRKIMDIIGKEI